MRARWETSTKYYEARLVRDLLEDWVLVVSRGGKTSRLGALRTLFVSSEEEGMKKIAALEKVRTRRGYVRVPVQPFVLRPSPFSLACKYGGADAASGR